MLLQNSVLIQISYNVARLLAIPTTLPVYYPLAIHSTDTQKWNKLYCFFHCPSHKQITLQSMNIKQEKKRNKNEMKWNKTKRDKLHCEKWVKLITIVHAHSSPMTTTTTIIVMVLALVMCIETNQLNWMPACNLYVNVWMRWV